jgi:threonine dehydratase
MHSATRSSSNATDLPPLSTDAAALMTHALASGSVPFDPTKIQPALLDLHAVERAAVRIAPHILRTPVLRSCAIDALVRAELIFKCENLQHAGAFKFRGASNAVWSLSDDSAARGVITHSSGNHGAALALAARQRGIPAHVVVPQGAVKSKLAAIIGYGATLHPCAPTFAAREALTERLQHETGATFVHPFTTPEVIAGQGTAALELFDEIGALDALITPVGGGGLSSGSAIVAKARCPHIDVFGAEPAGAADAYESLRSGVRVTEMTPDTISDGLRGILGAINFELMQAHQVRVLPVSDAETIAAMRLIFEHLKIVIEPSSATVLAAVLRYPEHFSQRRVGVVLSGGNVDLDRLPWQ